MASSSALKDLVVLTADGNIEFAVRGLLSRPDALAIRPVTSELVRHSEQDPGCLLRGPELLRLYLKTSRHALVLLDRVGSGREQSTREELEADLERRLAVAWKERAAAVVLDPTVDSWIWSDSPRVDEVLGWQDRSPSLREWLVSSGFLAKGALKPALPKAAAVKALRLAGKSHSSSVYQQLAQRVSFKRCTDPAFLKLLATLRRWFPPNS